jgi:hypothetical protein
MPQPPHHPQFFALKFCEEKELTNTSVLPSALFTHNSLSSEENELTNTSVLPSALFTHNSLSSEEN